MSSKIYKPLNSIRGDIRLIKLQGAELSSSAIRCSLIQTPLSTAPEYRALSYVWGKSDSESAITVDDEQFQVTPNLLSALRHLRDKNEYVLWVDAICINQESIPEKNNQVPRMSEIYQTALETFVWLGESDETVPVAFNLFSFLAAKFQGLDLDEAALAECVSKEPTLLDKRLWEYVKQLFTREYWGRAWIYQEFVVANKLQLVCGNHQLDSNVLNLAVLAMAVCFSATGEEFLTKETGDMISKALGSIGPMIEHRQHRVSRRNFETMAHKLEPHQKELGRQIEINLGLSRIDLVTLVLQNRWRECTEPRDSIYAYIGAAEDKLNMPVDYSKPVQEIFHDLFAIHAKVSGDLTLLSMSGLSTFGEEKHLIRPSWSPDLADKSKIHHLSPKTRVGNGTSEFIIFRARPSFPGNGLISTSGVRIGFIKSFTEVLDQQIVSLEKWSRLFEKHHSSDAVPWQLACFRTLTADWSAQKYRQLAATNSSFILAGICKSFMENATGFMYAMALATFATWSDLEQAALDQRLLEAQRPAKWTYQNALAVWTGLESFAMMDPDLVQQYILGSEDRWMNQLWDKDYNPTYEELKTNYEAVLTSTLGACRRRRLFVTADGLVGLGPACVEPDDIVCSVRGCHVPLVIRASGDKYLIVGECYVDGFMDEEIIQRVDNGELPSEEFVFI